MSSMYVDNRWRGLHGIARFAGEVIPRMSVPWRPLTRRGHPTDARDVMNLARLELTARDAIYTPGYNAGLTRARQFLTIHDLIHLEDKHESSALKRAYYERVIRPAARRTQLVFTVSKASKRRIETWLDDGDVEVLNVGNGCSTVFSPDGASWDSPRPYFLYVGNFRRHKNFGVILQAMRLSQGFDLVAVTPNRDESHRLALHHGVSGRVDSRSNVSDEDLALLIRGSLALVLPSTSEGFGLTAVEALRCGKDVLHWAGCESVREIVCDPAWSVRHSDSAEAWACAMTAVAEGRLSGSASARASGIAREYSWDEVASRVSDALVRYGAD